MWAALLRGCLIRLAYLFFSVFHSLHLRHSLLYISHSSLKVFASVEEETAAQRLQPNLLLSTEGPSRAHQGRILHQKREGEEWRRMEKTLLRSYT